MKRNQSKSENTYSQFRKKNSTSQTHLSKSLINLQTSFHSITNQRVLQLDNLESQLKLLNRNRSFSTKSLSKKTDQTQCVDMYQSVPTNKENHSQPKIKSSLFSSNKLLQKSVKPSNVNSLSFLNQSFDPIEQSSIQNEEDHLNQQQQNKNHKKDKVYYLKKKQMIAKSNSAILKLKPKASIDELNDLQKRIQTIKIKTSQHNPKKIKKIQGLSNSTKISSGQISQRNLTNRSNADLNISIQSCNFTGSKPSRQKDIFGRNSSRKVGLYEVINEQKRPFQKQIKAKSDHLIPTKMINMDQKQLLLSKVNDLKQTIVKNEIHSQNLNQIYQQINAMFMLIN